MASAPETSDAPAKTAKPRVVVIGAGFGGLAAARALDDSDVDVTVVDQRNHHTFQPLLYQVATAGLGVDDICYATRGIFQRQGNANAVQARVTGIDFDRRMVATDEGLDLPYDRLILALGAVTADFGVTGVAEHAFGLKSVAEAIEIRTHVLRRFEAADRLARTDEPEAVAAATTIVIVGGGPTGVEMAGGFAELIDGPLRKDFPDLDLDRARVVLVEAADRLLGTFAPRLGDHACSRLTARGVELRLSTTVEAVEPHAVRFADGSSIATDTVVWAAGIAANPLAAELGLPTGRGGRVEVDEHLRLPDHPEVHVIGDLALPPSDAFDGPVPQVAAAAIQGGRHVAEVITAAVATGSAAAAGPVGPFRYRDKGSMATIGRNAAVVELPRGPKITGFPGWVAWLALHLVMLIGFRNRANVLVNWAWNYLTYDRGSRLIIEPDEPDG
ncbi:MAG: NAD(P)/FAD-dependent oxidoreductase [Actinomycetota bacterium]